MDDTGKGGGIHNDATLTLTGVLVTGNTANPSPTGGASGGGIWNASCENAVRCSESRAIRGVPFRMTACLSDSSCARH